MGRATPEGASSPSGARRPVARGRAGRGVARRDGNRARDEVGTRQRWEDPRGAGRGDAKSTESTDESESAGIAPFPSSPLPPHHRSPCSVPPRTLSLPSPPVPPRPCGVPPSRPFGRRSRFLFLFERAARTTAEDQEARCGAQARRAAAPRVGRAAGRRGRARGVKGTARGIGTAVGAKREGRGAGGAGGTGGGPRQKRFGRRVGGGARLPRSSPSRPFLRVRASLYCRFLASPLLPAAPCRHAPSFPLGGEIPPARGGPFPSHAFFARRGSSAVETESLRMAQRERGEGGAARGGSGIDGCGRRRRGRSGTAGRETGSVRGAALLSSAAPARPRSLLNVLPPPPALLPLVCLSRGAGCGHARRRRAMEEAGPLAKGNERKETQRGQGKGTRGGEQRGREARSGKSREAERQGVGRAGNREAKSWESGE